MKFMITGAALLLTVSSAMAQSMPEASGTNGLSTAAPPVSAFVVQAAQSDMFEIGSSQLADKDGSPAIQSFAAKMIIDHKASTAKLKSILQDGSVKATLPPKMSTTQQAMFDKLSKLHGEKFDKQFQKDQVNAHNDAVDLFQRYAKEGSDPALKAFASSTLPIIQHHLEMAKMLLKSS
jgi:putative membrane protein